MNKTVKVLQWSVAIINLSARKFETEFWQNKPDSSPPSVRKYFTIGMKNILQILTEHFVILARSTKWMEFSLSKGGDTWHNLRILFYFFGYCSSSEKYFICVCNCLSYGQNELERNNIYVDTFSLQEKQFLFEVFSPPDSEIQMSHICDGIMA